MTYTTNQCINPSVELNKDGYVGSETVTLAQDFSHSIFGSASLKVSTSGLVSGESVQTPHYLFSSVGTEHWSVSLYLKGEGAGVATVTMFAGGGTAPVSQLIPLSEGFQRVTFDNVTFTAGNNLLYIVVSTGIAQVLNFWIDSVQYEKSSVSTEYCDGDQYGCVWLGTPRASASERGVEFLASFDGSNTSDGSLSLLIPGDSFSTSMLGEDTSDFIIATTAVSKQGAFDDFAMYPIGTEDPALSYVGVNTAGQVTGEYAHTWERFWAMVVPPIDYPNSTGYSWKRAAYAAVGFKHIGITGTNWMYLDAVQLEKQRINTVTDSYSSTHRYDPGDVVSKSSRYYECILQTVGNAPTGTKVNNTQWRFTGDIWGPTEYTTPRQLHSRIKPTVMNFVQNPSCGASSNYWVAVGSTSVSRVTGVFPVFGAGALRVHNTALSGGQKAYIDIEHLIVGRTYTFSAYIKVDDNIYDVTVNMANGTVSLQNDVGIPYGGDATHGYGQGPYGGVLPPGPDSGLDTTKWYRVYKSFTATSYTERMSFSPTFTSDVVYPADFWLNGVMVEEGAVMHDYVDGNLGDDYLWESNGVVDECRSYYYAGRRAKAYLIADMLAESVPIGITAADPEYAKPFTQ